MPEVGNGWVRLPTPENISDVERQFPLVPPIKPGVSGGRQERRAVQSSVAEPTKTSAVLLKAPLATPPTP